MPQPMLAAEQKKRPSNREVHLPAAFFRARHFRHEAAVFVAQTLLRENFHGGGTFKTLGSEVGTPSLATTDGSLARGLKNNI
ncbi:MAG: hypothetical protein D4R77_12005 [Planctomycetaceae bacterium]|nr:MAG: hypothetical protein D4R77_12005 [Planctomycetaceae bacterium]